MTIDTKSMSFDFSDSETEKFREAIKRIGEYIAYLEQAEQKMVSWQHNIDQKIQQHEHWFASQLNDIQIAIGELQGVMTETGIARWRIAAETALKQGSEHLQAIAGATSSHLAALDKRNEDFSKTVQKSFERLDRASAYTIKNISEAISSFRINDFQQFTEHSCQIIENTSRGVIYHLKSMVKWFHWKSLSLAFCLSLLVSIITSIYITGEMPWENHDKVIAQRAAGEALKNAWPLLSDSDKELIIKNSQKPII